MSRPADSGKLEEQALPVLLHALCGEKETGVLRLERHGISKAVYIDKGKIIFASSTEKDDRLGELLLRRGLLRVQQLENALACFPSPKRLGAILVEMGYLKGEDLVWGVIEQVKEIVFGLFLWSEGEYRFDRGALPSKEVITLNLSTPEIIVTGINRIDRWWQVLPALGSLDSVYHVKPGHEAVLKQMKLDQGQTAILRVLVQPTTVRDLCGIGILPDFETCRMLWAFRVIGLVEPTEAPACRPKIAASLGQLPEEAAVADAFDQVCSEAGSAAQVAPGATAPEHSPAPSATPAHLAASAGAPVGAAVNIPSPADAGTMVMEAIQIPPAGAPDGDSPGIPPAAPSTPAEAAAPGAQAGEIGARIVPPAAPAAAPPEAALDESVVDAALFSFNRRQRRLHGLLEEKMGDKAPALIGRSLKSMAKEMPALFKGVTPAPDGSLDAASLKSNILSAKIDHFAAVLDLLIDRVLESIAATLGPAARREIVSELKELRA